MGDTTTIQWADASWSPVIGCTRRHTGCANCYAEQYGGRFGVRWGPDGTRRQTSPAYWRKPLSWARKASLDGKRIRVFPSLCDPLDPKIPEGTFLEWMDLIRRTARVSRHVVPGSMEIRSAGIDWLLLTKRPERWAAVPEDVRPLVWLGTSVSDQATADEWIPRLLGAEGFALRFLSVEPLVGPVDLDRWVFDRPAAIRSAMNGSSALNFEQADDVIDPMGISWIIIGGESGPKARPCDVAWIRAIVGQCRAAGVPPFVKQLGARPYMERWNEERQDHETCWLDPEDSQGGDPSEWPEDLRVREFPEVSRG